MDEGISRWYADYKKKKEVVKHAIDAVVACLVPLLAPRHSFAGYSSRDRALQVSNWSYLCEYYLRKICGVLFHYYLKKVKIITTRAESTRY